MELTARALSVIVNSAVDTAIIALDRDGRVLTWSLGAQHILGWTEAEMLGQRLDRIFPPETDPQLQVSSEMADALNLGKGGREGWRMHADGSRFWAVGEMTPVNDPAAYPVAFVKVIRDRTEWRLSEEALREQTRSLAILNRTAANLARETDLQRLVQAVTDAGVELTRAQFGAFFYNVTHESGERYRLYTLAGVAREAFASFPMPRNTAVFASTFAGTGIVRSDDITKDPRYGSNAPLHGMPHGHLPVVSYLAVPVVARTGRVIGALMFGHPKPGVFDARTEQTMVGLAAEAAIAIDNATLHADAQREIEERRRAELALQQFNMSLEAQIAERTEALRQNEAALRQAQKMEAVGQLTGGLAHDFNNLLMAITGSIELLKRNVAKGRYTELERYADSALGSAKRAASLTHRLLAFSRRQTLDPKPTDVNRLVTDMADLVRRTVGPSIELDVVTAADLWTANVDQNQLESALLNLCINARDAMPDGGRLTIATYNGELDKRTALEHDLEPGPYLSLCVTDTGTGMTPEVRQRAFDPFYTTKPLGMGTGLGLSMVYGFARQSGGQVRITSEVGQGTTMCIFLPRHEMAEGAREPADVPQLQPAARRVTVLVIDDEPTVRMVVSEALGELGYDVIEADDGKSGLRILEGPRPVELLVTDVGLPGGMNGRQVADAALAIRPALRVLFMTGYAENAVLGNGYLEPGMQVLTKPFTVEQLSGRVMQMVSEATPDTAPDPAR